MYMLTATKQRLQYARVCILINSDSDLPGVINYIDEEKKMRSVSVNYAWKPRRCSACKSFGHSNGQCLETYKPPQTQAGLETILLEQSVGERHINF